VITLVIGEQVLTGLRCGASAVSGLKAPWCMQDLYYLAFFLVISTSQILTEQGPFAIGEGCCAISFSDCFAFCMVDLRPCLR